MDYYKNVGNMWLISAGDCTENEGEESAPTEDWSVELELLGEVLGGGPQPSPEGGVV